MKVYRVMIDNRDDYEFSLWILGIFSTRERANEAGQHYCDDENKKMSYEDEEGNIFTYDSYYHKVYEDTLDEYYFQNLSPLAKAIEE